ncbi:MAG: hypothetical protein WAV20_19555, partial [Blastocatellia bacterium]
MSGQNYQNGRCSETGRSTWLSGLALYMAVLLVCFLLSEGLMGSAHARALLKYAQEANAGSDVAQDDREIRPLEAGKPMERELAGGQGHSYRIELISGQYLRVVVYQKGIDVAVTVFGPNGNKVAEIDSPNGMNGPEPISVIAEA